MVLRSLVGPLAASVDRVVSRAITGRSERSRRRSRAESLGHEERLVALDQIARVYQAAEPLDQVDHFFGPAAAATPDEAPAGSRDYRGIRARAVDLSWPSRVQTFVDEHRLAQSFREVTQNSRAAARLITGPGTGRPVVILVHGYRAGSYPIEERVWPVGWLLSRGVDVALFVLPFHAVRADGARVPRFPGSDPRFTNEGFRQAIDDLRALRLHLAARGAPWVGAMGMSLGGYTVSLLATVDDGLAFVAPIIPLASFADVALAGGRLVGSAEQQALQHAGLERAHRVVSPFSRSAKVPGENVVVVGGEGDRITPLSHAERLAAHFSGELVTFPGGHLLQVGRSEGFRAVGRMLERRGLIGRA